MEPCIHNYSVVLDRIETVITYGEKVLLAFLVIARLTGPDADTPITVRIKPRERWGEEETPTHRRDSNKPLAAAEEGDEEVFRTDIELMERQLWMLRQLIKEVFGCTSF